MTTSDDTQDQTDDVDDRDHHHELSPLAQRIGSDEGMVWIKRIVLLASLAFLVGAVGYAIGVRTTVPPSNAVDVGFLEDMTEHHDQAVDMSLTAMSRAESPTVRKIAQEIVMFQRKELGLFQAYQDERGVSQPEYDLDRTTMAWMNMPTPLRSMHGMASEAELAELETLSGAAFDKRFLELMMGHHLGGAHMGEYAAANAADPKIREMAGIMARNQTVEVREYQALLERLSEGK